MYLYDRMYITIRLYYVRSLFLFACKCYNDISMTVCMRLFKYSTLQFEKCYNFQPCKNKIYFVSYRNFRVGFLCIIHDIYNFRLNVCIILLFTLCPKHVLYLLSYMNDACDYCRIFTVIK